MPFVGSHVWKVRQKYGHDWLLLPAASVIVEREDGAILLMKRADTGKWSIIGGYAEEGAGFQDTAITELEEEAAIKANKADLIPFAILSNPQMMQMHYPTGDKVQVFAHVFILRKWENLDQALDEAEVTELKFLHLHEISDDMMHTTTQEEIRAYKEYLRTGEFQSR